MKHQIANRACVGGPQIPDISLQDVFRGNAPFFVADVVTVALLLAFPGIVLWLPNLITSWSDNKMGIVLRVNCALTGVQYR